jgi:uncharacterized protein
VSEPPARSAQPFTLKGPFASGLTRSEAGRWFLIALGGFVVAQLASTILVTVVAALTGHSGELATYAAAPAPAGWYVASGLIGLWAGFALAAWGVLRSATDEPRSLWLSFRAMDLLGLPLGLAVQIILGLAYRPFIHNQSKFDAPIQKLTGGSQGTMHVVIIALTILGAPFFEELFFRGVLLQSLMGLSRSFFAGARTGVVIALAVLADGLLFGASHGELAQLPGLIGVGVVLSLCYLWTGRLGLSIFTHVGFNSVAIFAYTSGVVQWVH